MGYGLSVSHFRKEFDSHKPDLFLSVVFSEFLDSLFKIVFLALAEEIHNLFLLILVKYLIEVISDVDFSAGLHDPFKFVKKF